MVIAMVWWRLFVAVALTVLLFRQHTAILPSPVLTEKSADQSQTTALRDAYMHAMAISITGYGFRVRRLTIRQYPEKRAFHSSQVNFRLRFD